jgi:outer membrane lipoprotein-sorting protein
MSLVRRLSTRSLIAFAVLAVLLVSGGAAIARSALSTGTPPPAKALDQAILSATQGGKVAGITARINFTNTLIASGALPQGMTSPLLSGATGRLWVQADGAFRLELQSANGDTQISSDGTRISVFDAASNTVYQLPASQTTSSTDPTSASDGPLTMAKIDDFLAKLGTDLTVSGATPTTVAGQGAYEATVSPKQNGGLLGGLGLAFDAATGVPLRVSITAAGSSTPVLQLEVTDISYGAVSSSDVTVTPPAGAKVVDVASSNPSPSSGSGSGSHSKPIEGLAAVRAAAGFTVTAPDTLVGLTQANVRLIDWGGTKVAVATYGKGLGSIVVAELPATAKDPLSSLSQLPSISIGGTTGRELATALGTAITFQKDGVRTIVAGSVPTVSAEQAARELVS